MRPPSLAASSSHHDQGNNETSYASCKGRQRGAGEGVKGAQMSTTKPCGCVRPVIGNAVTGVHRSCCRDCRPPTPLGPQLGAGGNAERLTSPSPYPVQP